MGCVTAGVRRSFATMHSTANRPGLRCHPGLGGAASALVLSTVLAGCASSGTAGHVPVPKPFPMPDPIGTRRGSPSTPPERAPAAPPAASPSAASRPTIFDSYALVGTALELRGTPYLNGGASPRGFDCSGFTQYVFAQYGVALPRAVRDQYRLGTTVKAGELAAGDLVFFTTTDPGASHVAIAVGGDEFVHAPSSTGVVRVERLGAAYWSSRFVAVRRVR